MAEALGGALAVGRGGLTLVASFEPRSKSTGKCKGVVFVFLGLI